MANQQPPSHDRGPWWIAAAGGTSGITALILQDHPIVWAITAAFIAWLLHNMVIAWLNRPR